MKTSYLNTWLQDFPKLAYLLNSEDKAVLDKIDPRKYQYHNLTRETEVIRIINDHKPQAWKWVRLFPALKNLSPEDYVILDHIVPNEYFGEVTEADIRRIIEYRKSMSLKEQENSDALQASQYYENHKDEIIQEEKTRTRITKWVKYSALFGGSFISAGIVLSSFVHICIGSVVAFVPIAASVLKLKDLDKNSVIPKPRKEIKEKLGLSTVLFIILYYIGFIGMSITLSSLLVWDRTNWETARSVFFIGLSTIGVSLMLFLILAIVTPSEE